MYTPDQIYPNQMAKFRAKRKQNVAVFSQTKLHMFYFYLNKYINSCVGPRPETRCFLLVQYEKGCSLQNKNKKSNISDCAKS